MLMSGSVAGFSELYSVVICCGVSRKFGDKYLLLVNKTPSQGSPARAFYWVGNFVNESFVPTNPRSKNLEVINLQLPAPFIKVI